VRDTGVLLASIRSTSDFTRHATTLLAEARQFIRREGGRLMIRIGQLGLAIALSVTETGGGCLAAWTINSPPATFSDDFNDPTPFFATAAVTPYDAPPGAYPTPNNYLRIESGSTALSIMDAYCPSEDCYGFGNSLLVEFDWLAVDSAHLVVQTTYHPPVFPYVEVVNRFTGLFSDLPPASPDYVSTPESRRVSFFTTYGTLDGSDLLTLEFLATNAAGEGAAFGLDNLTVATVPEPATAASMFVGVVVVAHLWARGHAARGRGRLSAPQRKRG
jgi:hypothetical protein